jgi:hypothetical protein
LPTIINTFRFSWYYLLLDLIAPHRLPWRKLSDQKEVRDVKLRYRKEGDKDYEAIYGKMKCSSDLVKILTYFDGLRYADSKFKVLNMLLNTFIFSTRLRIRI